MSIDGALLTVLWPDGYWKRAASFRLDWNLEGAIMGDRKARFWQVLITPRLEAHPWILSPKPPLLRIRLPADDPLPISWQGHVAERSAMQSRPRDASPLRTLTAAKESLAAAKRAKEEAEKRIADSETEVAAAQRAVERQSTRR